MNLQDILRSVTHYENLELYDNKDYIDKWESWYKGVVSSFHNYRVYNGKNHIQLRRLSLGMAKKVCEDWANLLINEKTDITLSDELSQTVWEKVAKKTKFWRKANTGVEKTFALGMGAWVVSVENLGINQDGSVTQDGVPNITFVGAKNIVPITIEDDIITECAFIHTGTNSTHIAVHAKGSDGKYVVTNISADGTNFDNLQIDYDKIYTFNTGSEKPWFVCLKPNIANNIEINSPLGISVFANAIDCLKQIDLVFDSYANEFILGKKRIFINTPPCDIDAVTGEQRPVFDSNDVVMYQLPEAMDNSLMIQDSTQSLRVADHQTALQNHLNLLSYSCGLGTEHYKFDKGGVSTATQIISENSEMFRNIKKQEILIEDALIELVEIIIYACNAFTQYKMNPTADIEVKFDDSIIIDKESERASDRLDVSMGVMSKAEYRSKWYNEDLETATVKIEEMDSTTIQDYSEFEPEIGATEEVEE